MWWFGKTIFKGEKMKTLYDSKWLYITWDWSWISLGLYVDLGRGHRGVGMDILFLTIEIGKCERTLEDVR